MTVAAPFAEELTGGTSAAPAKLVFSVTVSACADPAATARTAANSTFALSIFFLPCCIRIVVRPIRVADTVNMWTFSAFRKGRNGGTALSDAGLSDARFREMPFMSNFVTQFLIAAAALALNAGSFPASAQ